MFTIAGVSTSNGQTKVRFANDMVTRIKTLVKGGHTNVELLELPEPMTKPQAVTFLKTTHLYGNSLYAEAIQNADDKYNSGNYKVTSVKVNKPQISIDAILARATEPK